MPGVAIISSAHAPLALVADAGIDRPQVFAVRQHASAPETQTVGIPGRAIVEARVQQREHALVVGAAVAGEEKRAAALIAAADLETVGEQRRRLFGRRQLA